MGVPETMKQLKGWRYPLYVDQTFFKTPELIDTLVDHGVPREQIILKEYQDRDSCDLCAFVRQYPKDYDHIVITIILQAEKDEFGRLQSHTPIEIARLRITSSEWFKRTGKTI
jgi:hypothetical protein